MLTQDGYVLKTPPSPFTYPVPEPTTPVSSYVPPPQPQKPVYPNEVSPKPTPPQPKYPSRQPPQPTTPKAPIRQTPQTPAPTPPRRIPSTTPPKYLPPTGDRQTQSSNQDKQVLRGEDQLSPQIFPPGPKFPKSKEPAPAKCASALVCTPENFCSSIGVISETPVEISPFRVPLTDCVMEDTGAAGKCCRDPNYVDPWPVNLAGVCAQKNKASLNINTILIT